MDYSTVTPGVTGTQTPQTAQKEKAVPVVSKNGIVVHKASVGKKLYDAFFGATPKEVYDEVKKNVLKPSLKKILLDFIVYGASMMINGKDNMTPTWSPYSTPFSNVINYNAITTRQASATTVQQSSNTTPNGIFTLDTIVFNQYADALKVKNSMASYLAAYHVVSVSDYYDFCNADHDFMTDKWGWDNLNGIDVVAVGNKWKLVLPPIRPIAR